MSNPKNKLETFLSKRRIFDSNKANIISIPGPNFSNGKYFIKSDKDFEQFLKLYNECCFNKNIDTYFLETPFNYEKLFGFDNLNGYGMQRIYGFLAERYMSYWFQKNTKFLSLPIYFKDISDYKL